MDRGHEIETRHLIALRAVAEEGSFAGAADVLGYSQAAISQQIAGLERVIGTTVFDRPGGPRPATITPAGRLVLQHGCAVLDRLETLESELRLLRSGTGGRVVCGTFQSVTVRLIPDLVAAMREEMPDVHLSLFESDSHEELTDLLVDGQVDAVYLASPVSDARLDMTALGRDPYVLLLPAEGAPRTRGPMPLRELAGQPMIGQKESDYQAHVDDGLRAHGVSPQYVFRTNDNGGVLAMVRAGLGIAVMPLLTVDVTDPGIVVRTLLPELEPRIIYIALRREGARLPAAERLVEIARRTSRSHLTTSSRQSSPRA